MLCEVGALWPCADGGHAFGHLAHRGPHWWPQRYCGGEQMFSRQMSSILWQNGSKVSFF